MEKKELITRKELKEDARLKQILLTKKGEQQHLKMMNFFSGSGEAPGGWNDKRGSG